MIPLRDNIPSRTTPIVNYTMIGLCTVTFLLQVALPQQPLVEEYGMIPARVLHPEQPIEMREFVTDGVRVQERVRLAAPSPIPSWLTLATCVFLHGGWMHFLGNMWFLFIFGDNVEDRIGHVGYLIFYLTCGVAASLAHLFSDPHSMLPTIGASGAIAGVMGAYMLLYPRALVVSLIPIFVIVQVMALPAPVYLGIWFLLQFFQGAAAISSTATSGVAWWAHIGGFAFGFLIAAGLRAVGETSPPVAERLPYADHVGVYRYPRRGERNE